jgi:2',3'-cyclic-nucleotide 2'-phosphodiesterase/3'-nucleotidase/5'-nucleotidase
MLRELSVPVLFGFACAALLSTGAGASELPPLSCRTVRAPGATCVWVPGATCTWEEGGTPTVCAPLSGARIELRTAGTYRGGYNNASASSGVAYDPKTQRLFVANGATQSIDVVNLGGGAVDANRPQRLAKECSINVANPGLPPPSSGYTPFNVALRKDGILAVVLQDRADATRQGLVAFYDAQGDCSASPLSVTSVGFMPARASFTPDGKHLLVTNEGEPTPDYLTDALGSVSIIDLGGGIASATATEVTFEEFDPLKEWLIGRGVRITGLDFSTPEPHTTTSVARDLEPEGIAISLDSRIAWITLPENNAVAALDIRGGKFSTIQPFGYKDYSVAGNGLDPTDNDGPSPNIQTWPIRGMYMPKQVALAPPSGSPVLVYPDRGVRRNLTVFGDEVRLSDMPAVKNSVSRDLDPTVFPPGDPTTLALRNLQLKVSWVDGDSNGDGLLEHIYAFGGRSFSIRLPDNRLVFDSGDDFEQITAQAWRDTNGYFLFNTPDDENRFDDNSDLRGPEPVSVATGRIGLRTYAFIGLERVGGVMTYDITNPFRPVFQHYINNRNFALNPKDGEGVCAKRQPETGECPNVGDQSAQEIVFISARESPIGAPLLIVSNVTSGSATILWIDRAGD